MGTLSCEDPEQAYQNYTYSIIGPGSVPFTLGGKDNQILMVNGKLDYETGPIVDVIVRVTDSGGLFKEVTLKIQVQGKNKHQLEGLNLSPGQMDSQVDAS